MTEKKNGNGNGGSQLALMKKDVVDVVAGRIAKLTQEGELHLPENYSAENAMKAAWLALQEVEDRNGNKALAVCTPNSVANALLAMIKHGLDPGKSQCYFVVFGKGLVCMVSYFGKVALVKRVLGQKTRVFAECVYEGDEFEYEIVGGQKTVPTHKQKLANVDNDKIIAAYAVIDDGEDTFVEIMPMAKIERAWQQGQTKGKSPAHTGFRDEMAKKTVISRLSKMIVNSSDDSYLQMAVREQEMMVAEVEVEAAAELEANATVADFDEPVVEAEVVKSEPEPEPEEEKALEEPEEGVEGDQTPRERFMKMISELELDPTVARRVAASRAGLDDVRKLSTANLGEVLKDEDGFLEDYNKEALKDATQSSLV